MKQKNIKSNRHQLRKNGTNSHTHTHVNTFNESEDLNVMKNKQILSGKIRVFSKLSPIFFRCFSLLFSKSAMEGKNECNCTNVENISASHFEQEE